jgi:hypothetical protein
MKLKNIMRVILVGGTLAYMAFSALPASAAGIDNGSVQLKHVVFDDATPSDPPTDPTPTPEPPTDPAPAPTTN